VLAALLKGKLTDSQENLEDLLTSTVFGLLAYVPPASGLLKLLHKAVPPEDNAPSTIPMDAAKVHYKFWPWLQEAGCHGAEPDVLIEITDGAGRTHVVLVEAKFKSAKSSFEDETDPIPTDQLAREWHNLVSLSRPRGWVPHMVYLTDDYGPPVEDLNESTKEFGRKRPGLAIEFPLKCSWLSWRHLREAFGTSDNLILKDLCRLAEKYRFNFFSGFPAIAVPSKLEWEFQGARRTYAYWQTETVLPVWAFKP
jgi:hypothetical protein